MTECLCEGEFIWACGPECECYHHSDGGPWSDNPKQETKMKEHEHEWHFSIHDNVRWCGKYGCDTIEFLPYDEAEIDAQTFAAFQEHQAEVEQWVEEQEARR